MFAGFGITCQQEQEVGGFEGLAATVGLPEGLI